MGERRRAQAVGLAIIYLAITTLGLGTRAVIWQGSSDETTVYRSYVLETYVNQTLIRQKDYHLIENYTVQDLHQTDDTHRHPNDVAQGAVTSLKHGPVDTDLVQLTYTMNDATHQAVVKVPRNQYYALFTSVRNAPLPMSLVDNQLVVDTYYQPAPDLTINYQIGGENHFGSISQSYLNTWYLCLVLYLRRCYCSFPHFSRYHARRLDSQGLFTSLRLRYWYFCSHTSCTVAIRALGQGRPTSVPISHTK